MDTETGQNLSEPRLAGRGGTGMPDEIDLLDYIEVLVWRRWLIFWVVVLFALGSYGYLKLRAPEEALYKAEANVVVPQGSHDDFEFPVHVGILRQFSIGQNVLNRRVAIGEDGMTDSVEVSELLSGKTIHRKLKYLNSVSEFSRSQSGVLTIEVTFNDSLMAAELANAYVNELILYYSEKQAEQKQKDLLFIKASLNAIEAEFMALEDSLLAIKRRHWKWQWKLQGEEQIQERGGEVARLERQVETKNSVYVTMLSRYEGAWIESNRRVPKLEVLNYASAEDVTPVSRTVIQWIIISSGVGLSLSIFLAFFLEFLKRNRKSGRLDPILEELRKDVGRVRRLFR